MKDNCKSNAILFVDDEEKALKYFDKVFADKFSVMTCSNVADAKALLDQNSNKIAVLLSDQRMPDEKGTDLLRYSREKHPHIIRLLTTAYSDLGDAIEAVNTGEILRYIQKPWGLNELEAELQYALRFYNIRYERDLLLKEKLNVKQRLVELNRVRDLIVMASAFTHIRNPLHAIESFLLQFPLNEKSPQLADLKSLDIWSLLEKEIQAQLDLNNTLIKQTSADVEFTSFSLVELAEKLKADSNHTIEIEVDSSPEILGNAALLEKMLLGFITSGDKEKAGKISLKIEKTDNGGKITIIDERSPLKDSSILGINPEFLANFFICYHHGGRLTLNNDEISRYEIDLPSDPKNTVLPELDDDWLEDVFYRFEDWST